MMQRFAFPALLMLSSCGQPQAQQSNEQHSAPAPEPESTKDPARAAPAIPPAPGTTGGLPDDRTPLNEGSIDLSGPEGAGQLVQKLAALLEQGHFAEARKLWGGNGVPDESAAFLARLEGYREVHAQVGKPSSPEGAAGSIYVEVPVVLYGRDASGTAFHSPAIATVRRVNDVPGSTAAQRSWHLYSLSRR
jgi:hypothetical protein